MIMITIITGGIVLSASVIAGMLMFYQLREVNDTVRSGMALFAAETGIEETLQCYFKTTGGETLDYSEVCKLSGSLSNGATYKTELICVDASGFKKVNCFNQSDTERQDSPVYGIRIKSVGQKDSVERAVDSLFGVRFN